jgi:hypothetical protein
MGEKGLGRPTSLGCLSLVVYPEGAGQELTKTIAGDDCHGDPNYLPGASPLSG